MEFKGRCINFELWYTNDQTQDLNIIYSTLEHLVKLDIDAAINDGCNTVIGLLLYEGFLYKNDDAFYKLLHRIYQYGTSKGIVKFVLVCGIAWDYQKELNNRNLNFEIIPFDYSASAMWQSYKNYAIPPWNPSSNKFLFLGGVPSRKNRILLLSKFYEAGMLTQEVASWSFFKPYTELDNNICRQLLSHYNEDNYQQFLCYAESRVDDKYFSAKEYSRANGIDWKQKNYLDTDFFKDPNYIDPNVFLNTSISIIAEGHVNPPANDYRFLTEKVWRAVINRHPFILADNEQRKNFAKSLGLDLFEDFFVYDYDNDKNLNGVVSNVKCFLDNKHNYYYEINEKINSNLISLFKIINKCNETLIHLQTVYNIREEETSKWFNQKSFDHLFRIPDSKDT